MTPNALMHSIIIIYSYYLLIFLNRFASSLSISTLEDKEVLRAKLVSLTLKTASKG